MEHVSVLVIPITQPCPRCMWFAYHYLFGGQVAVCKLFGPLREGKRHELCVKYEAKNEGDHSKSS